jgi:putative membrane protein
MMMGFGGFGMVLMLLFWGALIALAVWAINALFPGGRQGQSSPVSQNMTARQILDMRYARGDLNREQYELMKEDLR